MKISLNWLKDSVEFKKNLSIEDIRWRLTEATAEIEGTVHTAKDLDKVVIGKVKELAKHPDADKLKVAQVDVGTETLQIVCGGKNLVKDMLVAVSLPGAMVRWHGEGELVEVGKVKLRGVQSIGMICAAEEIGLSNLFPDEGPKDILDLSHLKAKPGQALAEVLGMDDVVFEIDNHSITHRADLFSHLGFARECVALGLASWKKKPAQKDHKTMVGKKKSPVKVVFREKAITKNYYGTVIKNLSTKPAPEWLRTRLNAVGIRSINAIVDITNYIMMDVGQPNHAFDLRVLDGKTFTNRLSKAGEKVTTLDGIERELEEGIIIAETEDGIVDLAGIMGAENSEIKEDTKDIYFHSSQFDNVMIRKAMISLGHRTDGGTMHEKNIEAERSEQGYIRGLELFAEVFPEASFEYETVHIQNDRSPQTKITLPMEKLESHIGIHIEAKSAQQYLEALGFTVKTKKQELEVTVPSWRVNNVQIPEDIIEEIVRIHGYSKVPALPPTVELSTPVKNHKRRTRRTLQAFLTGQGFQEEANFSFLSEELLNKMGQVDYSKLVEIANPVSEDFRFMRPNFLYYLLNNLSKNQIREMKFWKSFEMGAVYHRLEQEVTEEHLLTMVIGAPGEKSIFHDVKGGTTAMMEELSLPHQYHDGEHEHAHPGRCLALMGEDEVIGNVYEIHPLLKDNFKLKGSVVVVEINLDKLYELTPSDVLYQQINRHPEALLDINVVVASTTMMSEIDAVIRSVEAEYLKDAQLLDVYEGENLGADKKSFTFALSYQHPERTLEEKEIQDILEKLIAAVEKAGGVVRR